jgi:hypothetical protein
VPQAVQGELILLMVVLARMEEVVVGAVILRMVGMVGQGPNTLIPF